MRKLIVIALSALMLMGIAGVAQAAPAYPRTSEAACWIVNVPSHNHVRFGFQNKTGDLGTVKCYFHMDNGMNGWVSLNVPAFSIRRYTFILGEQRYGVWNHIRLTRVTYQRLY